MASARAAPRRRRPAFFNAAPAGPRTAVCPPGAARRRVLPARAPPRGPRHLMAPPCALALAPLAAACCPRARPHSARVAWWPRPAPSRWRPPRSCSARALPHPSLLAGDRQVLARGGCCIQQGL